MGLRVVEVVVRVVMQKEAVGPFRWIRWGIEVELRGSVEVGARGCSSVGRTTMVGSGCTE